MRKILFLFWLLSIPYVSFSQNNRVYLSYTYQSQDQGMTGFFPSIEYLYTGYKIHIGVSGQYFRDFYTVYDVVNPYTGKRHTRKHEFFRWTIKPRVLLPIMGNEHFRFSIQLGPFVEYLRTVFYQQSGYAINPSTGEFVDIPGYAEPYIGLYLGAYGGFRLDYAYKKWVTKLHAELDADQHSFPMLIIGFGMGRRF